MEEVFQEEGVLQNEDPKPKRKIPKPEEVLGTPPKKYIPKPEDVLGQEVTQPEPPQEDPYTLFRERKRIIREKETMAQNQKSQQMAPGYIQTLPLDTKKQDEELTTLNEKIKSAGFDEKVADDLADVPVGIPYKLSPKQLQELRWTNPVSYVREVAAMKGKGGLYDIIKNKSNSQEAASVINSIQAKENANFRQATREGIAAIYKYSDNEEEQEKLKNAFSREMQYYYGIKPLEDDERFYHLNPYQRTALRYLEDTDPTLFETYNKYADKNAVSGWMGAKENDIMTGYEMKMSELENMGMNLMKNAYQEKLTNLKNKEKEGTITDDERKEYNKLIDDFNILYEDAGTKNERYPRLSSLETERLMQESLGANNSNLSKFFLGIGEGADDSINWLGSLLEENTISGDLELMGDKAATQAGVLYDTEDQKMVGSDFVAKFSDQLKSDVQKIKDRTDITNEEKRDLTRELIAKNKDQVSFIPNDRAGKYNFTAKSVLSSVRSTASQLAGLAAQTYLTGGANMSRAKQLVNLFGNTFATTYNDYYNEALVNNIPHPSQYAIVNSTIEAASELINPDIDAVKKIVGKNGMVGKIINNVSKETWDSLKRKGRFEVFKKAAINTGKSMISNAGQETLEEVAGQIGGNLSNKYIFNQDTDVFDKVGETAVQTFVGMLPLGALSLPFNHRNVNMTQKYAFYEAGMRPLKFEKAIEEDLKNGVITPKEAEERRGIIDAAAEALKSSTAVRPDGTPLTDNEKVKFAFNQYVLKTIREQKKNAPTEVKEKLEKEEEKIDKENAEILTKPRVRVVVGGEKTETPAPAEEVNPNKESDITDEAKELLNSIKDGSKPAFITNKLKKIALDNGIKITDSTTPDEIINKLNQKANNTTSSFKSTQNAPIETEQDFEAEVDRLMNEPLPKVGEGNTESNNEDQVLPENYKDTQTIISRAKEQFKDDPVIERAVKFLEPIIPNLNIQIEQANLPNRVYGYSFGGGKVQLDLAQMGSDKVAIPVALHEMMHEATRNEIVNNEAFRGELDGVLGDIREALGINAPEGLIPHLVSNGIIDADKYGASNAHELVAEVFTNPKFNEYLKGIEYKGQNLFERIIEAIVAFFNKQYGKVSEAKSNIDAKDMAEFVMQLTEQVVSGNKSESGTGLPSLKNTDGLKDIIKRAEKLPTEKIAAIIANKAGISIEEATSLVNSVRKPRVRVQVGKPEEKAQEQAASNEPQVQDQVPNQQQGKNFENNPKAILNNIYNSTNISDSVKKKFEESGLTYKPQSHEEARSIAKDIIDWFGVDSSISMAESGRFDGDVNSMIFAEGIDRTFQEEKEATSVEDKIKLAEKWADYSLRYDEAARQGGRFISAIQDFYRKSPLGVVMAENKKRQQVFDQWFDKNGKPYKEVFEAIKSDPEFQKLIKETFNENVEPKDVRKKRRQKISNFFDKLKLGNKGANTSLVPTPIWDAAVEVMKQAFLAGEKIVSVIEKGINHINQNHKEAWDIEGFRTYWKEKLESIESDQAEIKKEVQERLLEKFRKKLSGLSDEQKNDIIRKSFKKLVENGALQYDDFKKIIAQTLGYGSLSAEEVTNITGLVADMNAVQDAADNVMSQKTDEDITAAIKQFDEVSKKAAKSATKLAGILYNKADVGQRIRSIIQLNTLGVVSLMKNPFYNIFNQLLVRFPKGLLLTLMDNTIYGASLLGNKLFGNPVIRPDVNVFLAQKGYWQKAAEGTTESVKQVFTGLTNKDYFQKEIYNAQIKPMQSWRDIWAWAKGKKQFSNKQIFDKFLQGTVGIPAEIVARGLNIGDKGFRYAAEGAIAETLGRQEFSLKGAQLDRFVKFPKETAKRLYEARGLNTEEASKKAEAIEKRIIDEGEEAVFQQENWISEKLKKLKQAGATEESSVVAKGADQIARLFGVLNMPFVKTPINVGWEIINLVVPELALLQSAVYGANAIRTKSGVDFLKAKKWMAHAAVGYALMNATAFLASIGAISGDDEDEEYKAKEAKGKGTYEKPRTLNISKLQRLFAGDSLATEDNDVMVDLSWFGGPGMIMNMQANKHENMTKEERENTPYINDLAYRMKTGAAEGLTNSVFQGAFSAIDAVRSGNPNVVSQWLNNMMNVGANFFEPATIAQLSRASREYDYEIKAEDLSGKLTNSLKSRFFMDVPPKINIWGEPMKREGGVADVALRMLGVSKFDKDRFAVPIFEDFKRTGNSDFWPSDVKGEFTIKGEKTKLTVEDERKFRMLVGQARAALVAPYVNGMATIKIDGEDKRYQDLNDETKVKLLKALYKTGYNTGKRQFLQLNPKYYGTSPDE